MIDLFGSDFGNFVGQFQFEFEYLAVVVRFLA